jgi:hypothetical protein
MRFHSQAMPGPMDKEITVSSLSDHKSRSTVNHTRRQPGFTGTAASLVCPKNYVANFE